MSGVHWFTNLETKKRHEDLILYKSYSPEEYPKYENYDAIDVTKTSEIPFDYDGLIGVPITFLDKYNPEQFEIIGNACDTDCNECGATRTITHTYTNDCDVDCDVCGATREVGDHVYDNACDTDCNECGEIKGKLLIL